MNQIERPGVFLGKRLRHVLGKCLNPRRLEDVRVWEKSRVNVTGVDLHFISAG
jgi:hypothetical protein